MVETAQHVLDSALDEVWNTLSKLLPQHPGADATLDSAEYNMNCVKKYSFGNFPDGSRGEEFALQCRRCGFDPWSRN